MSSHLSEKRATKPSADGKFQFISIQNPEDAKDRTARRLVRSHAVARGLENKRKLEQQSGQNFRVGLLEDGDPSKIPRKARYRALIKVPQPPPVSAPDAIQMLAADMPRLQALLVSLDKSKSREPVFSVSDELVLQNFQSVLLQGRDDRALLNAVMLTFAFAVTAGNMNKLCLEYQGQVLSSIRLRMESPHASVSESTLGAILLLAGVEARRGMPRQVQLHMGAIQQLLDACQRKGVFLSEGIKRAIFWQDLNSSIMTGSRRVFDHTTFPELEWRRDPLAPDAFILPFGFQASSHSLDHDFVEVLKDIKALQCIRDKSFRGREDSTSMTSIDNHQASIQSRLVSLPSRSEIADCCYLGAYLCSTMLRCKLWGASTIPPHLSLQLLSKLQETNDHSAWDEHRELLVWLLHIGGAFAPSGTTRSGYVGLLHSNRNTRLRGLYSSWPELLAILTQHIWSENAFMAQVQAFWDEVSVLSVPSR